jgi:hypothetical protein
MRRHPKPWTIRVRRGRDGRFYWSLINPHGTIVYRSLDRFDDSTHAEQAAYEERANICHSEIVTDSEGRSAS